MEAFLVYCKILGFLIPVLIGWAGYNKARQKYRTPWMWAIICWCTGLIGYIILCCSSSLDYDEELDYATERDTVGAVMFVLGLLWTVFLLWINYGNGLKVLGLTLGF